MAEQATLSNVATGEDGESGSGGGGGAGAEASEGGQYVENYNYYYCFKEAMT